MNQRIQLIIILIIILIAISFFTQTNETFVYVKNVYGVGVGARTFGPSLIHEDAQEGVLTSNVAGDGEVHRCCTADRAALGALCSRAAVPLVFEALCWAANPCAACAVHDRSALVDARRNGHPCWCKHRDANLCVGWLMPFITIL